MAAVLASGHDAVLSHESAAALWGLRPTASARIALTTPRRLHRNPKLIRHFSALPRDEITAHDGIPVTTVPRTLLDLAAVLHPQALARAIEQAEILRLLDTRAVEELLIRHPRRKGATRLRRLLNAAVAPPHTRSELEERFLAFLDAAGLPPPIVNSRIQGMEVDFAWPAHRLIVELDGYATHGTRAAFERDRLRDRRLQAEGWRVVRITWRQLHEGPSQLAAELTALLLR